MADFWTEGRVNSDGRGWGMLYSVESGRRADSWQMEWFPAPPQPVSVLCCIELVGLALRSGTVYPSMRQSTVEQSIFKSQNLDLGILRCGTGNAPNWPRRKLWFGVKGVIDGWIYGSHC